MAPQFDTTLRGTVRISGWNLPCKTSGMGLPYRRWKLHNRNFNRFDWLIHPWDGRTEGRRQTDRRTGNSIWHAKHISCRALKMKQRKRRYTSRELRCSFSSNDPLIKVNSGGLWKWSLLAQVYQFLSCESSFVMADANAKVGSKTNDSCVGKCNVNGKFIRMEKWIFCSKYDQI